MVEFRNSNGAIGITDGGTPRTFTIKARADISGGYWVNGSSAGGVVSSGADSYATSDVEGYPVDTQIGSEVIGLAINNIPSGTYGVVAQRGMFILPSLSGTRIGSIYSGWPVLAGSAGTVLPAGSNTLTSAVTLGPGFTAHARAMSTGGKDGEYVIVSLNI